MLDLLLGLLEQGVSIQYMNRESDGKFWCELKLPDGQQAVGSGPKAADALGHAMNRAYDLMEAAT